MVIVLKKLQLINFKKAKNVTIDFGYTTNIYGANRSGKTTLMDAFLWQLFGTDSTGRADFGIKPTDGEGNQSERIDVEVLSTFEVDGKEIRLRKILRENWVKKTGDEEETFDGNSNKYYWNEVPKQKKEYTERINELINEKAFRLLTNPLYFNSLPWQDRRETLLLLAGEISNEDLLKVDPDFSKVINLMDDRKMKEFKAMIAEKKKRLKDDLKSIPTRIDEANLGMPEKSNFASLRKSIALKENEIEDIDNTLQSASKSLDAEYELKTKKRDELFKLESKAAMVKSDTRSIFADAHNKRKEAIARVKSDLQSKEREITLKEEERTNKLTKQKDISSEIVDLNEDLKEMRIKWESENSKVPIFEEGFDKCPTCERELEKDELIKSKTTLTENFNTEKAKKLKAIIDRVALVKKDIANSENIIKEIQKTLEEQKEQPDEITPLKTELQSLVDEDSKILADVENEFNLKLNSTKEYTDLLKEIEEKTLDQKQPEKDDKKDVNGDLKIKKAQLKLELDTLKKELANEDTIKNTLIRIEKLKADEKEISQQLATEESSEFLADKLNRVKMDLLVERINSQFKLVKFRMFRTLVNQGSVECCDTLLDGVAFPDLNTEGQINAGLDIINTLCKHYGVFAPIFVDNRESVSDLEEVDSQVINLIVSKPDKTLRVE